MYTSINLQQGSKEWHEYRAKHWNASDVAAVLGISPYKTRSALVEEYATGIKPEVSEVVQELYDRGHALEKLARLVAEETIGEKLYPLVAFSNKEPKLSASFDGITMGDDVIFEHKTMSKTIRSHAENQTVPEYIVVQIQQQLLVSGAEKCLFMATNEDGEKVELWVHPDEAMQRKIMSAWKMFDEDVSNWKPSAPAVTVEAHQQASLPVLKVEVTGMVTASNVAEFRAAALDRIAAINVNLSTDQHFADADTDLKWIKSSRDLLQRKRQDIIDQTDDISSVLVALDEIEEAFKAKQSALTKLVKDRKEEIRSGIVFAAMEDEKKYREIIDAEFAPMFAKFGLSLKWSASFDRVDYGGKTKGLRSVVSMKEAVGVALVTQKLAIDQAARETRQKLTWFLNDRIEHIKLFPDIDRLLTKPLDDFMNVVNVRIDHHLLDLEEKAKAEAARKEAQRAIEEAQRIAAQSAQVTQAAQQQAAPAQATPQINAQAAQSAPVRGESVTAPAKVAQKPVNRFPSLSLEIVDLVVDFCDKNSITESVKQVCFECVAYVENNRASEDVPF